MKLRFTPRAAADIAAIADYIRSENPPAAERVRAVIVESLQILVEFPNIGRLQSVAGVRKLITRKYQYLVYYIADASEGEVVVLTVQHPARQRAFTDE